MAARFSTEEVLDGLLDSDIGSDLDVSKNWSSSSSSEDDTEAEESDDEPGPSTSSHGSNRAPIVNRGGNGGQGGSAPRGRGARGRGARGGAVCQGPPQGWTDSPSSPNIPPYTETPGPKCYLPYDASEVQFLYCLIGDDFFDMLARNTNLNAAQKSPPGPPYPVHQYATSDKRWTPTCPAEMKAFVAINILMGIKQEPEYTDYWSEDSLLNDPYISSLLSRSRYEKLCQYLHCSNVNIPAENDRLNKVRNLITTLQGNFKSQFTPGCCLSVDEAMIKYNGRLVWKQYMPKKPTKWGIKLWFLCDAKTGYCLNFEVYTGRGNNPHVVQGFGLGYTVVMNLMRNFLLSNHHVYADNFFSSIPLVEDLLEADTYYCGTLRKDRVGVPREIQRVPLKKYESVKWRKDTSSTMITHWLDKRHVYLISSNNSGEDTVKPRTRFHREDMVTVPTVVTDYNANMGGVDSSDQLRSYYNVGRSGRRWWKYLFWGLFNQGLINAYILWHESTRPHSKNKRSHSLKAFKVAIIHQLADGFSSRKRTSTSSSKRPVAEIIDGETIPGHNLVLFGDRKRNCVCCSRAGRSTQSNNKIQTKYGCTGCRASMCKLNCFNEWHHLLPEQ